MPSGCIQKQDSNHFRYNVNNNPNASNNVNNVNIITTQIANCKSDEDYSHVLSEQCCSRYVKTKNGTLDNNYSIGYWDNLSTGCLQNPENLNEYRYNTNKNPSSVLKSHLIITPAMANCYDTKY